MSTSMGNFARALAVLFTLLAAGCEQKPAAPVLPEQQIQLEGARNFRDLGGYTTRDGRRVKSGLLFRSDSLAQLSDADLKQLAGLHLRTIYDFRTAAEIEPAPDKLPSAAIRQITLSIGDPNVNVEELRAHIMAGDLETLALPDSYADVVLNHADIWREWFADLLDPARIPGVFHCTGGKDRTGVAAVLFLYAVGVPRETALQDYMASNYYLHDFIESSLWKARFASLFRVDGDRFRTLLGVRASYMEKALQAIEARYGSLDAYLEQALGMDAAKREQLRALYLE